MLSVIISQQETIDSLEKRNQQLKGKSDELDKRQLQSERYSSKNCLIFIGLDAMDPWDAVLKIINE